MWFWLIHIVNHIVFMSLLRLLGFWVFDQGKILLLETIENFFTEKTQSIKKGSGLESFHNETHYQFHIFSLLLRKKSSLK